MNYFTARPVTPRFKPLLELPMRKMPRPLGIALALFFMLMATSAPLQAAVENDSLERMNRTTHSFNRAVDRTILKPLAIGYEKHAPSLLKKGIGNFFRNLGDVGVTVNDLLQLNFKQAAADVGRLAVNTTLGLGGLVDVAGPSLGLEKQQQDFGKTLAYYGVNQGPYLVLPLLGPSTLRDAFGLGLNRAVDPIPGVSHVQTRNTLMAGEAVDFRADVLGFDDLVIGDDYLFVRGAYLQHREAVIAGPRSELAFEDF